MSALTDLQDEAAALQTAVDTMQAAVASAIAALEAQIGSGGTTDAQLQPIIDSLKATQADVSSTPTS
jgi:hypothetical protein